MKGAVNAKNINSMKIMDNENIEKRKKRSNGEGSICLRTDGRWLAKIQIGIQLNGKPKMKYLYGKTEKEVKLKLKEYKKKLEKGIVFSQKITLNDYIETWLKMFKYKKIKNSSYDRIENTFIHHIKPFFGSMQLSDIKVNDIQELINFKADSLSYSSIKKIYELLNGCFKHAFLMEDIEKNPMLGVVMPKSNTIAVKTKEIEILSDKDIEQLTEIINNAFETKNLNFRYAPIYLFMLNTGLRMGEVLALKWEHVDFEGNPPTVRVVDNLSKIKNREENAETKIKLVITDTKTKNGNRIIPLNKNAIKALNQIREYNILENKINREYIVTTNEDTPVNPSVFREKFKSILVKLGMKHCGLHALRHTFASRALRNGIDIKIVSELLGHSNVSITYNKYIHIIKEQKVQAVELLDNL